MKRIASCSQGLQKWMRTSAQVIGCKDTVTLHSRSCVKRAGSHSMLYTMGNEWEQQFKLSMFHFLTLPRDYLTEICSVHICYNIDSNRGCHNKWIIIQFIITRHLCGIFYYVKFAVEYVIIGFCDKTFRQCESNNPMRRINEIIQMYNMNPEILQPTKQFLQSLTCTNPTERIEKWHINMKANEQTTMRWQAHVN